VLNRLRRNGAEISFHDPYIERLHSGGREIESIDLDDAALAAADCVVVLTPHSVYDLQRVAEHARLVFDARNALRDVRAANVVVL
jgi:UDP-N-acetyl-D-glucosamine dehydrogenase